MRTHNDGSISQTYTNPTPTNIGNDQNNEIDQMLINTIVSKPRVEWALFSFDKYKSPGDDQVYPVMLKK